MSKSPDNTAHTWRDLANQLTPEQIAKIEHWERENIPPGITTPEHHLNHARQGWPS